jgi:hypothetical protein
MVPGMPSLTLFNRMIGVLPIVSKTLFSHIKKVAFIEGEIKLKKPNTIACQQNCL